MATMSLIRDFDFAAGEMLTVDKPLGWTSFDVVNKIRCMFHIDKIGHAGTLDPLATGLLIVCTGKMTKEIDRFAGLEKEYEVEMRLGATTPSHDAGTPVVETGSTALIAEKDVTSVLALFEGHQVQVPPMWSAAKIDGKRLYKFARKGLEVERRPREVFIRSIVATRVVVPEVSCTVVCSKGTYIRTLVDDVGRRLGCGAYVTALRRSRIGDFTVREALTIEDLVRHRSELVAAA